MNLLLVIPSVMFLCETVSTQNCALTVTPPDSKSGCCGHSAMDGVTTSGTIARIDEYPWMALVEYEKEGKIKLLCGAVLISGGYALSAGHCFSGLAFSLGTPVNVRLGEYDLNNDGPDCVGTAGQQTCNNGALTIPIEKFTVHPGYYKNDNRQNDITLIRLAKMVNYNDFIRPICLPSLDVTLKAPKNLYMTVAGWGAVNDTVTNSNVLRRVHVPYVDFYLCRHKYNDTRISLSNGQLCAGSRNRDACQGDSGGPLILLKGTAMELAGIVSLGRYPCGQDTPSVYTKVYAYNDWIKTSIAADELLTTSTLSPIEKSTTAKPVQPTSGSHDFYSDFIVFKE